MGQRAKAAGRTLGQLSAETKNTALRAIADRIDQRTDFIMAQNALDVAAARENGLAESFIDRLLLTPKRVAALSADVRNVATLPDPVGSAIDSRVLPNGIQLTRRRIPIGVIGVIYESRPNVTIDIASLCLKTGNAAILRGGKETLRSNIALIEVIQDALAAVGISADAVQYISDPDRALVAQFLRLDQYIDMIIPRGGYGLHQLCKNESNIPVVTGGIGIVHIFVDESADLPNALDILVSSKIQKP
ncbi:MAG TPA: glutamate-5-semialdehyde dehydrogenase, partial [Anaerolineae bacterium]|nr:glutamate-5-semialdehyde dehydrogenase [Anaerolineae bacterium]